MSSTLAAPVALPGPSEACDKDGTRMELLDGERDFERWSCPTCTRRIVIDRDQGTSVRAIAWRGHPWEWPPNAV